MSTSGRRFPLPGHEGRGGFQGPIGPWVCPVLPPEAHMRQELRAPPCARPDLAARDSIGQMDPGSLPSGTVHWIFGVKQELRAPLDPDTEIPWGVVATAKLCE